MAVGVYGSACVEKHEAMIYDRGGSNRLHKLVDVSTVQWWRVLDGISEAHITIGGRACEAQANILSSIEPRRHELVIFRGDDRVWEGPIVKCAWFADRVEIGAHDVLEYLFGTPLSKAWPNEDGGGPRLMTDRVEQIITYELTTPYDMETNRGPVTVPRWENIDPPANVLPFLTVHPGTVLTRSTTEPFELPVGEHLDNLARGGLQYTTVGRAIHVWDGAVALGRTRVVTENDFNGEVAVYAYGAEHASIAHVTASAPPVELPDPPPDPLPPEEPAISVGNAGGALPYYGVWTHIHSLVNEEGTDTPSQEELNSQAQRNLVAKTPVPLEVRLPEGSGLTLDDTLTIHDLVAGVEIPLLATLNLRPLNQMQRLDKVTVSEDTAGEIVSVNLSPAGAIEEFA